MSEEPEKLQVEKLELNRETVADLTEAEAEQVQGGVARRDPTAGASNAVQTCSQIPCPGVQR